MSVSSWWALLGVLALEVALVFGFAMVIQHQTRAGVWRRTIWQVGIFALALLVVAEISGVARGLASLVKFKPDAARHSDRVAGLPESIARPIQLSEDFRRRVQERMALNRQEGETALPPLASSSVSPQPITSAAAELDLSSTSVFTDNAATKPTGALRPSATGQPAWWPGIVWLLGTAIFGVRTAFIRFLLLVFRARYHAPNDAALEARVQCLARRLRIRRAILLKEFPRIAAPVAFGVCRPTIGLPPGFTKNFSPAQQDAVLAHELAHLAARDPLWHALADLVVAALWWHPLAWLARRQLHAANESAADEASVVVADGPKVLAECLVQLGGRLTAERSLGWLNMAGFRSDLGHRVERLINLPDRAWSPPSRFRAWIARTAGPAALAAIGIFCTAWITPPLPHQTQMKGEPPMRTLKQYWLKSLANVALVATLGTDHSLSAQNQPNPIQTTPRGKPAALPPESTDDGQVPIVLPPDQQDQPPIPSTDKRQNSPNPDRQSQELRRRYGLPPDLVEDQNTPSANAPDRFSEQLRQRYGMAPAPQNQITPDPNADQMREMMLRRYGISPAMNQRMAARYGLLAQANSTKSDKSRTIEDKLERIVLNEIVFDALPLSEVVKFLFDESKKRDPEKQGINFLITNNADTPAPTIDPATGFPVPASVPDVPMDGVAVKFNLPLRNVRLLDVLNAIVKVADQPVKYSVEEFGVVFSPDAQSPRIARMAQATAGEADQLLKAASEKSFKDAEKQYKDLIDGKRFTPAEPEQLKVRTFKVDSASFLQGLEGTFGIASPGSEAFNRNVNALRKLELQLKDAEEAERGILRSTLENAAGETSWKKARSRVTKLEDAIESMKGDIRKQGAEQSKAVQETLRTLFDKLGVNMDSPKAVFYNPMAGIVMVKVSARDLEVVQAALETLGGNPISAAQHSAWLQGFGGGAFGGRVGTDPADSAKVPVLGDLPTRAEKP